jgi:dipeptidyl aminopeptidase/acylaminoacyl peptidase
VSGALHVRGGAYKDDARGVFDGRVRALFVVDVASGAVRRLAARTGDVASPAWSPDGASLAFVRRASDRRARMCGTIAIVDVATDAVRTITPGDGPAYAPAFSPDGRTIAFAGHGHGDDNRFGCEAFVVPVEGGEPRSLTRALDRPVGNVLCGDVRSGTTPRVAWSADGREVVMLVTDGGACSVVAVAVDRDAARTLAGGERDIAGFALAPDGALALAYATPREPSALALVEPGGAERLVATLNPWLDACAPIAPERLAVATPDGTVDAWLLAPPVQPGPHAAFGWTFVLEYQILAACGIGVVFGNPRGSLGYGEAFGLASTGDWGGGDARDVLAIVDAALARGFDPQRVACIGQSYGGFMTTWLLGHTARFATGITMDAVNDLAGLYGSSDVGWSMETEFATEVRADAGRELFDRSALRAARSIAVPVLIVHGERDQRCPIDQAEQLYTALRYDGASDVEFVRFPGGTHELSRSGNPRERVLRLRAIANWLVRHLVTPGDRPAVAGDLFAPLAAEDARIAAVEERRR